jgi:hypothetical protein
MEMNSALPALKRLLAAVEHDKRPYPGDLRELKAAVEAIENGDRRTPGKFFGRGVGRPRKKRGSDEVAVRRVSELMAQGVVQTQAEAVEWLTARTHLKREGPRELSMSAGTLNRLLSEALRQRRSEFLSEIEGARDA